MLGGGSDGAHDAPDYGEKQAIFMQFAGKERAQSLHASLPGSGGYATGGAAGGVPSPSSPPFIRRRR